MAKCHNTTQNLQLKASIKTVHADQPHSPTAQVMQKRTGGTLPRKADTLGMALTP